jgi:hypothetical protein
MLLNCGGKEKVLYHFRFVTATLEKLKGKTISDFGFRNSEP